MIDTPGDELGVERESVDDHVPLPSSLLARTWTWYEVLGSRPVMESLVSVIPCGPAVQELSLDFLYWRS